MSDSPANAAGKPTACEKAVTMIEFRIGEHSRKRTSGSLMKVGLTERRRWPGNPNVPDKLHASSARHRNNQVK
jgi:hypothetical protein